MEEREKADHKLLLSKLEKVMLSLLGQTLDTFEREQQLKIEKNKKFVQKYHEEDEGRKINVCMLVDNHFI